MINQNKLIPNSTQIPNVLLDIIIPQANESEAKCLLYICRRTYGFHKERDRISYSQFIDGIKNKDGKRLDHGAGVARASVNIALKNLTASGLIKMIPTKAGNFYEINIDLDDFEVVVQNLNQFRIKTKSGSENRPKQVHLLNLQKKGNKGNKESLRAGDKVVDKSDADEHKRKSDRIAYEADKTFGQNPDRPRMSLLMKMANEKGEDVLVAALGRLREYLREGKEIKDFTPYLVSMCQREEVDVCA